MSTLFILVTRRGAVLDIIMLIMYTHNFQPILINGNILIGKAEHCIVCNRNLFECNYEKILSKISHAIYRGFCFLWLSNFFILSQVWDPTCSVFVGGPL